MKVKNTTVKRVIPETIESVVILNLKECADSLLTYLQVKTKKVQVSIAAIIGERNLYIIIISAYQEITIDPSFDAFKYDTPTPTMPAPSMAPNMQCVPDIGNPIKVESIVNPIALNYKMRIFGYCDSKHHCLLEINGYFIKSKDYILRKSFANLF